MTPTSHGMTFPRNHLVERIGARGRAAGGSGQVVPPVSGLKPAKAASRMAPFAGRARFLYVRGVVDTKLMKYTVVRHASRPRPCRAALPGQLQLADQRVAFGGAGAGGACARLPGAGDHGSVPAGGVGAGARGGAGGGAAPRRRDRVRPRGRRPRGAARAIGTAMGGCRRSSRGRGGALARDATGRCARIWSGGSPAVSHCCAVAPGHAPGPDAGYTPGSPQWRRSLI